MCCRLHAQLSWVLKTLAEGWGADFSTPGLRVPFGRKKRMSFGWCVNLRKGMERLLVENQPASSKLPLCQILLSSASCPSSSGSRALRHTRGGLVLKPYTKLVLSHPGFPNHRIKESPGGGRSSKTSCATPSSTYSPFGGQTLWGRPFPLRTFLI